MKAAIIFIGTGKYRSFFEEYHKKITSLFLKNVEKTFFVFTDETKDEVFNKDNVEKIHIDHKPWPWITLNRFSFILSQKETLQSYSHIIFIDADLWPENEIKIEDIIKERPIFGVQHPGFVGKIGPYETDTRSSSNIFDGYYNVAYYRQGCFWGGESSEIIKMSETIEEWVKRDSDGGIVAIWHDVSHLNKYFLLNPRKVHTLHPGFAQPQYGYDDVRKIYPTKLIHLHKDMKEFPRFSGIR